MLACPSQQIHQTVMQALNTLTQNKSRIFPIFVLCCDEQASIQHPGCSTNDMLSFIGSKHSITPPLLRFSDPSSGAKEKPRAGKVASYLGVDGLWRPCRLGHDVALVDTQRDAANHSLLDDTIQQLDVKSWVVAVSVAVVEDVE